MNQIVGFAELRLVILYFIFLQCLFIISPGDQTKIRAAIKNQRIDPVDIPESAEPRNELTVPTQTFQRGEGSASGSSDLIRPAESSRSRNESTVLMTKRKAVEEPLRLSNSTQLSAASQQEVIIIEDEPEDNEIIEELYCTLPTSVVGIRYYEGKWVITIDIISDVLGKGLSGPGKK